MNSMCILSIQYQMDQKLFYGPRLMRLTAGSTYSCLLLKIKTMLRWVSLLFSKRKADVELVKTGNWTALYWNRIHSSENPLTLSQFARYFTLRFLCLVTDFQHRKFEQINTQKCAFNSHCHLKDPKSLRKKRVVLLMSRWRSTHLRTQTQLSREIEEAAFASKQTGEKSRTADIGFSREV